MSEATTLSPFAVSLRRRELALREKFIQQTTPIGGRDYGLARSHFIDEVIKSHIMPHNCFAVFALAGYGRCTLAPFSDVDMFLLLPDKNTPSIRKEAQHLLYELWDGGVRTGHHIGTAHQMLEDMSRHQETATAFLDIRFIGGDLSLRHTFEMGHKDFFARYDDKQFIKDKRAERLRARQKTGGRRFDLNPHIKEGAGGLRDVDELGWIARMTNFTDGGEGVEFLNVEHRENLRTIHDFLLTLRAWLHNVSDAPEDLLSVHAQKIIASRMHGYEDEVGLMRDYFHHARHLRMIRRAFFCHMNLSLHAIIKRQKKKESLPAPFALDEAGLLMLDDLSLFEDNYLLLLQFFALVQVKDYAIAPSTLVAFASHGKDAGDALRHDSQAGTLFLAILKNRGAGDMLSLLGEIGFLSAYLPDFAKMEGLIPRNPNHDSTVDEHTWRVLQAIYDFQKEGVDYLPPQAKELMYQMPHYDSLFCAAFFHDIAKEVGIDHPAKGAVILQQSVAGWDGSDLQKELAAFLVREHLTMSHYAFHRDLDDQATIIAFKEKVQTLEKLRLLFLFTIADIKSVSPNQWNRWKAALLWRLYRQTEDYLAGRTSQDDDDKRGKIKNMLSSLYRDEETELFLKDIHPSWFAQEEEILSRQARFYINHRPRYESRSSNLYAMSHWMDQQCEVTHILLAAPNRHGLWADMTAAISHSGGNITHARCFTMKDGWALNDFSIEHKKTPSGELISHDGVLERLYRTINAIFNEQWKPDHHSFKGNKDKDTMSSISPSITINNLLSDNFTVVETIGHDRMGLLHDMARRLAECDIDIHRAIVASDGGQAVDVFYVRNKFGVKITSSAHKKRIITALLLALKPR